MSIFRERIIGPKQKARLLRRAAEPSLLTGTAIENDIYRRLGEHDVSPQVNSYVGKPALLESTDRATPEFFKALQNLQPDGYIVGVGAGAVLAQLRGFENDRPPKGLIMVDINPLVTIAGRILVKKTKEAATPEALVRSLFAMTNTEYDALFQEIIDKDPALKKGVKQWGERSRGPFTSSPPIRSSKSKIVDVPSVIIEQFPLLKQLADAGKIASFYADFRNPHFIDAVKALPEFYRSTNIIFTSNSIDCHSAPNNPDIDSFRTLSKYDNPQKPPIFVTCPGTNLLHMQIARSYEQLKELYVPLRRRPVTI